jgi:hypothetical protein
MEAQSNITTDILKLGIEYVNCINLRQCGTCGDLLWAGHWSCWSRKKREILWPAQRLLDFLLHGVSSVYSILCVPSFWFRVHALLSATALPNMSVTWKRHQTRSFVNLPEKLSFICDNFSGKNKILQLVRIYINKLNNNSHIPCSETLERSTTGGISYSLIRPWNISCIVA